MVEFARRFQSDTGLGQNLNSILQLEETPKSSLVIASYQSCMADASLLFDWIAFLDIGLISVTIPTYAISVTFFGRERKRAISERERRVEELEKKMKELSAGLRDETGVAALEKEIEKYKRDIKRIRGKVVSLSVWTAFFAPFIAFSASLGFAAIGFLYLTGTISPQFLSSTEYSSYFVASSLVMLVSGVAVLSGTLIAINRAAMNPETLSALRFSFESSSTAEKFSINQEEVVTFILRNLGKEMGENISAQIYFPPEFGVSPAPILPPNVLPPTIHPQPTGPTMTYPGRLTATTDIDSLHEDVASLMAVRLKMPSSKGTYKVPVQVWERRLGESKQELTFEIQ